MVNTAQMPKKHTIFTTVLLPSNYIFENIDATIWHLHKRYLENMKIWTTRYETQYQMISATEIKVYLVLESEPGGGGIPLLISGLR